jgi:hypothetical protein
MKNLVLIALFLGVCYSEAQSQFSLKTIASGLIRPVDIASTYVDGDKRLFVVEKDGKIKIIDKSRNLLSTPFLNIDPKVNSTANERGLLGLAFHPDYKTNRYFFVNYSNTSGHTVIARYQTDPSDPNVALPSSEKIILTINQPFNNHNGGDLNFGADGYLYIGMGDGGSGGDPGNRSQNPKDLLGKMLRIDINTETEKYLVPVDNPFVNAQDTLKEIWSIGLRNPWRFSFDRLTNEMWIGDVGQDNWEEISVEPAGKKGLNYGWRCFEGKSNFNTNGCLGASNYVAPIHVYPTGFQVGCSVTGGYVYRGMIQQQLIGKYIYVDFCSGRWWALAKNSDGTYSNQELADLDEENFSSLGEDVDGELYAAGLASGEISQIIFTPSSTKGTEQPQASLKILPTIVDQTLTWEIKGILPSKVNYQIIGLQGLPVMEWQDDNQVSNSRSISTLPSGEYILVVKENPAISGFFVKF